MPVLNIALIGSENFARNLAKKSDSRDIESYVFKEGYGENSRILSFLRPLKYPDSLRPLLSVLNVTKVGVIEISKLDSSLGEILVSFASAGIERGIAIINSEEGNWIDLDQIKIIFSQLRLDWKIYRSMPENHEIRELLFDMMEKPDIVKKSLILPIDQHFAVQGIGLVGIGYVQSGQIKKHDTIEVISLGEKGIVRSLQVMDDDVEVAYSGDRVGIAIRNLREEALNKGCIISHPNSEVMVKHTNSSFELDKAPFQKKQIKEDDIIHASTDMQFVVGRITNITDNNIKIKWENPLWVRSKQDNIIILTQLDAKPMRIIGTTKNIIPE
jgi:selenocysteine-specific translation elongation factor